MTPRPWKVSNEKAVMTQEVMVSGASLTKRADPSVLDSQVTFSLISSLSFGNE